MKISHRLIALTGFTSAGLVAVTAVGYFAVTSIQGDLRSLTLQATPLQNRTYEVQERTERALGALLRLSLATASDEAARATAAIDAEMKQLERLAGEITRLDPSSRTDLSAFRTAQSQIAGTVERRLRDDTAYHSETENARAALARAEPAIKATRAAVAAIETEAGKSADQAQDASRALGSVIKAALSAQARLKELAVLVSDTDAVGNRFRLTPLKERLKATADSLQRLDVDASQAEQLKAAKALALSLSEGFLQDASGLFALRTDVLAGKKEQEAAYQKQRRAILQPIDDEVAKLNAAVDSLEVQIVKQRQVLEAAMRFRNEPGGVVAASDSISLDMKETTATIRLLMLAVSAEETKTAEAALTELVNRMGGNVERLRASLLKMGKPQLVANVNSAAAALLSVRGSVAKVAAAKRSVIASGAALQDALGKLKQVATAQAADGARQVKSISERQQDVVAAVDGRVNASLALILGISALIIVLSALLSIFTVRIVTRRLDSAVLVAEAVSQGRLDEVPEVVGNDETTRLLTALAHMVRTLTEIVGHIRRASESIDAGSGEISRGNDDLASRSEQQAGQLQQTVAAMEQLIATVRANTEAAQRADGLALEARKVAIKGGEVVGQVVHTMDDIQASSKRIAEIIGVIDGIAFQTNILALNAAVEAARAGEHGRGFAVVASEVRALAGKTAQAAQQVKQIISASVGKVEAGSRQVRDAGSTMQAIVAQVHEVSTLVQAISRASHEQFTSLDEVNAAVGQIDQMTQRNAELVQQSSAASQALCEEAEGLNRSIAVFRLGAQESELEAA
ncbi:MAG: methyl-accepting chemotaxis protein [Burkholderiaceae bacterium]